MSIVRLLIFVALLAAYIPARSATRVDAIVAVRYESYHRMEFAAQVRLLHPDQDAD